MEKSKFQEVKPENENEIQLLRAAMGRCWLARLVAIYVPNSLDKDKNREPMFSKHRWSHSAALSLSPRLVDSSAFYGARWWGADGRHSELEFSVYSTKLLRGSLDCEYSVLYSVNT